MNFLGMGPMEIMLVLLVAFIFLGPDKMVDAAKLMGKAMREGKRLMAEMPKIVIEDDDIKVLNIDPQRLTRSEPTQDSSANTESREEDAGGDQTANDEAGGAPVTFKPGRQARPEDPPSETPAP